MNRLDQARAALADAAARHNELIAELQQIAERSDELDTDTERAWTDGNDELDTLSAETIPELERQIAQLERVATATAHGGGERVGLTLHTASNPYDSLRMGVEYGTPAQVRAAALEGAERSFPELSDHQRSEIARTIREADTADGRIARHVLATSRPGYRSAFQKVIGGADWSLTDTERQALEHARAASLTGAAGGFAVPTPLDPTIIMTGTHDGLGVWRSIATVKQITTNVWTGISSAGVTASYDGEAAEVSDDAPTLAQPTITATKAQAFVPFSIEVQQDWASMEYDIRAMIDQARADLEGSTFSSATASGPIGLITALDGTASELSPATAEVFAVADVYSTMQALPARFRARASWMADISTYNSIRQFDTSGGANMWEQMDAARPGVLLGRPAYEEPGLRGTADINVAATADNFILVFGDFSQYYIVDRVGMAVEVVPHLFATANNRPSGQRGIYASWRTGADSVQDGAFRVMNVNTTA